MCNSTQKWERIIMKEKIFWLFVILFIIGTVINIIATEGYTEAVKAKEGNSLEIKKLRFDEGDLDISVSIPNNVLTHKEIGKHSENPDAVLLKCEINKGNQTDIIEITKIMNYAGGFGIFSFKPDRKSSIKFTRGYNTIKLKIIAVSKEIENAKIDFTIRSEVSGIMLMPDEMIYKIIWCFNFWIVWGIGLIIWGIFLYRK